MIRHWWISETKNSFRIARTTCGCLIRNWRQYRENKGKKKETQKTGHDGHKESRQLTTL